MKAAAVEWTSEEPGGIASAHDLMQRIEVYVKSACGQNAGLLVLPAFAGCLFRQLEGRCSSLQELIQGNGHSEYIEKIRKLSVGYKVAICPGSFWEREEGFTYHTSCVVSDGQIILWQRQLYLARWEREHGLSRGTGLQLCRLDGWNVGIVLSTDVFYPQVSRALALKGADIVLVPVGFAGPRNSWLQISGMWREVQQNMFFAVESGFNGELCGMELWGESLIHAPLEASENGDGFLARSKGVGGLITAELDNSMRRKAISGFDVLSLLNPGLYRDMNMFGGVE